MKGRKINQNHLYLYRGEINTDLIQDLFKYFIEGYLLIEYDALVHKGIFDHICPLSGRITEDSMLANT